MAHRDTLYIGVAAVFKSPLGPHTLHMSCGCPDGVTVARAVVDPLRGVIGLCLLTSIVTSITMMIRFFGAVAKILRLPIGKLVKLEPVRTLRTYLSSIVIDSIVSSLLRG